MHKRVTDACARALACCGYTRRRHGILLQPRFGCLDLRLTGTDALVVADPVVGVRHEPVERILVTAAGWGEPVACVRLPLGRRWKFPAGADLSAGVQELTEAVVVQGQPFIDRWAQWPALVRQIETLAPAETRQFLVPAVALADGDTDRALGVVRAEVARLAGRADGYAVAYRNFARRLSRLAEGGS
ncbi:hypothetical protein [Actinoplanes sp. NPDC020271]|uniref:hypothetical protein n=1 Tax=Actinoplanes sp. NPDC020271 TaxID=3363896 RepID=UPI00379DDA9B